MFQSLNQRNKFQKNDFCIATQSGESTDTSLDGFPDIEKLKFLFIVHSLQLIAVNDALIAALDEKGKKNKAGTVEPSEFWVDSHQPWDFAMTIALSSLLNVCLSDLRPHWFSWQRSRSCYTFAWSAFASL